MRDRRIVVDESNRNQVRKCGACDRNTNDQKPWCSDHINRSSYIRTLIDQVDQMEARNIEAFMPEAIFFVKERRSLSRKKLGNLLGLNQDDVLLGQIVDRLEQEKRIKVGFSFRGRMMLEAL